MFLAARYINTYRDWNAVMEVIKQLGNAEVQTLAQADRTAQVVFLDVVITSIDEPAPGVFILVASTEGVALYLASGLHLSSTPEGTQKAFARTYVDEALQGESEDPMICRIFEFHYQGASHVLH